jgi:hypothetical protein
VYSEIATDDQLCMSFLPNYNWQARTRCSASRLLHRNMACKVEINLAFIRHGLTLAVERRN